MSLKTKINGNSAKECIFTFMSLIPELLKVHF